MGSRLPFGSVAGAEYLIHAIALQDNELGRLLGQGVKRAAATAGGGMPGILPFTSRAWNSPGGRHAVPPGMGLAYMTADRGACHQRGFMVAYEVGGREYMGKPVDTYGLNRKAEILKGEQDYLAGLDALVKCDFGAFGVTPESYTRMFNAATGRSAGNRFLNTLGERIWNQTRLFNLREGLTAGQDRLPTRIVSEPLPSGPHKGRRISEADMAVMLTEYYRERGWDAKGRPTEDRCETLGLNRKRQFDCGLPPSPEND